MVVLRILGVWVLLGAMVGAVWYVASNRKQLQRERDEAIEAKRQAEEAEAYAGRVREIDNETDKAIDSINSDPSPGNLAAAADAVRKRMLRRQAMGNKANEACPSSDGERD